MKNEREQLALYLEAALVQPSTKKGKKANGQINRLDPNDRRFHDWYRFVLSFPPHLIRDYIEKFGITPSQTVLDPFVGTGTTLVECKRNHITAIGLEANPFAQFASTVKTNWEVNPDSLKALADAVAKNTYTQLRREGIDDNAPFDGKQRQLTLRRLSPEVEKLLLKNSISALPLHKTLVLLDNLDKYKTHTCYGHATLALANALVFTISNLYFGPEVGVGKQKKDIPVIAAWLTEVQKMVSDLASIREETFPTSFVHLADARCIDRILPPNSIDAVITSPPYPNEKDYTRTTRLESVILGFIKNKTDLRSLKSRMVRSNTRGVYKDDDDDKWVASHPEIQRIADEIERRRMALGKDSGFEKLYGKVTKLYFGGMARHLDNLRMILKPGAHLAYVVGDQASYLQVMIRTGNLLAELAQALGYELVGIDLFRTRFATATREQLREEVVVLRWKGM
jgi:DNA modification methylase